MAASAGTQRNLIANEGKVICDATCVASVDEKEMITLPSGLQYRDIVVGKGPTPPVGYQVHSQASSLPFNRIQPVY